MQLHLIESYTQLKAKPDYIFTLKREIVHFCLRLAELKQTNDSHIELLKHHVATSYVTSVIHRHYYDYLQVKMFDAKIFAMMIDECLEVKWCKNGEQYYLFHFSQTILSALNNFRGRPKRFTSPLYYNYNGSNKMIDTLYKEPFYGRVQKDVFDHDTLVMCNGGVDIENNRYFAHLVPNSRPYPTFFQPFIGCGRIEEIFLRHNTTFKETYQEMQGLFKLWYGMRF